MPQGIVACRGVTWRMKRRGEMGDPCWVPTETGAGRLVEPRKTRVHNLSDRKGESQSTI